MNTVTASSLERSPTDSMAARKTRSILLVEDDVELCGLMADFFAQYGFRVEAVHDGRRGLAKAIEGACDIVILDVMLPSIDGFEVLRQLRKRSSAPVIMLTARTSQRDRVTGLDAGADDYLPKPFEPEELLARIREVLRRTGREAVKAEVIEAAGFKLDSRAREIQYFKNRLEVTSLEFDILELLMRSAGRVVSRDELATILHHRQSNPWERSLDVHISHLRKKLESAGKSPIRTVRGIGYLFVP
jgi:two-component system, OmpR family, response regulator CpxR